MFSTTWRNAFPASWSFEESVGLFWRLQLSGGPRGTNLLCWEHEVKGFRGSERCEQRCGEERARRLLIVMVTSVPAEPAGISPPGFRSGSSHAGEV